MTVEALPGSADEPVRDFTFLVPDDWARVRMTDPAVRSEDIRRIARVVSRGLPDRDSLFPQVVGLLQDSVDDHAGEHTVEVYLALSQIRGLPVACSLAVDVVPAQVAGSDADQILAGFLATTGSDGTAEVVDLMTGPVPRVRRRRTAALPGSGKALESEILHYLYPVPGGGFVLLTFATPQLQLLDQLIVLFDAVAGSFRWLR